MIIQRTLMPLVVLASLGCSAPISSEENSAGASNDEAGAPPDGTQGDGMTATGGTAGAPTPMGGTAGASGSTRLVGTWRALGTQTLDCDGSRTSDTIDGSLRVNAVSGSTDVTVERSGCPIELAVNGDLATYLPGQHCSLSSSGISVTLGYDPASTVTLRGPNSAWWHEVATAHLVSGTSSLDCVNTMDAELSR